MGVEIESWPPKDWSAAEDLSAIVEEKVEIKRRFKEWRDSDKSRQAKAKPRGGEAKPLWPRAMERGGFCDSCGQLDAEEAPHAAYRYRYDREYLACPRDGCDGDVSFLTGEEPNLPGGYYAPSSPYGMWRYEQNVRAIKGRGAADSFRYRCESAGKPEAEDYVLPEETPEKSVRSLRMPQKQFRCQACAELIPVGLMRDCCVNLVSGGLRLGLGYVSACIDCAVGVPSTVDARDVDGCCIKLIAGAKERARTDRQGRRERRKEATKKEAGRRVRKREQRKERIAHAHALRDIEREIRSSESKLPLNACGGDELGLRHSAVQGTIHRICRVIASERRSKVPCCEAAGIVVNTCCKGCLQYFTTSWETRKSIDKWLSAHNLRMITHCYSTPPACLARIHSA